MNGLHLEQRRAWWRGCLSLPALFGALGVATAEFWPDMPFVGPLARMIESAAPHMAVLSLILGAIILWLGGRTVGILVLLIALSGLGGLGYRHWARSAPLVAEAPQSLRVLWYNMLHSNPLPQAELIAALEQSSADVILLTEASPMTGSHARLRQSFATVEGCRKRHCDIMILARDPALRVRMQQMPSTRTYRMGIVTLDRPEAEPLTLVGVHMLKPWFFGLSASDEWMVVRQARLNPGPLVIVGDFNAAPWSKRVRQVSKLCALKSVRAPVPTWPAALGRFGIPIDLVLTRSGAVIRAMTPWGGTELGSNHRGLMFDIGILPQADATPPNCFVPHEMQDRMADTTG